MELKFSNFDYRENLEEQRTLFIECFPENQGLAICSNEHYYWKFHSKEGNMATAEYAVYNEGVMIGYYAGIPYDYQYPDGKFTAAMVCDVMTGVKARGKGVFTKLGTYATSKMAEMGFDITTGYPIRPEVIPGHLKVGWKIAQDLPMYGRIIRFNSLFRSKNIGFLAPIANSLNSIFSKILLFHFKGKENGYEVKVFSNKEISKILGLDEFFSKWQKQLPISLFKNRNFLAWRLNAPEKEYQIVVLYHHGQIVGILISTEFENSGIPCLGILDLTMLDGYHQKSKILLGEAIRIANNRQCEIVLLMMSPYWYKRYGLIKSLFVRTPYKFYLIIKNLSKKVSDDILFNPKNWHLMWIDSDDL